MRAMLMICKTYGAKPRWKNPACINMPIEILHKSAGMRRQNTSNTEMIATQGKKEPKITQTEQHPASVGGKLDFVQILSKEIVITYKHLHTRQKGTRKGNIFADYSDTMRGILFLIYKTIHHYHHIISHHHIIAELTGNQHTRFRNYLGATVYQHKYTFNPLSGQDSYAAKNSYAAYTRPRIHTRPRIYTRPKSLYHII